MEDVYLAQKPRGYEPLYSAAPQVLATRSRTGTILYKSDRKRYAFKGLIHTTPTQLSDAAVIPSAVPFKMKVRNASYNMFGDKEGLYFTPLNGALPEVRSVEGGELGDPVDTEKQGDVFDQRTKQLLQSILPAAMKSLAESGERPANVPNPSPAAVQQGEKPAPVVTESLPPYSQPTTDQATTTEDLKIPEVTKEEEEAVLAQGEQSTVQKFVRGLVEQAADKVVPLSEKAGKAIGTTIGVPAAIGGAVGKEAGKLARNKFEEYLNKKEEEKKQKSKNDLENAKTTRRLLEAKRKFLKDAKENAKYDADAEDSQAATSPDSASTTVTETTEDSQSSNDTLSTTTTPTNARVGGDGGSDAGTVRRGSVSGASDTTGTVDSENSMDRYADFLSQRDVSFGQRAKEIFNSDVDREEKSRRMADLVADKIVDTLPLDKKINSSLSGKAKTLLGEMILSAINKMSGEDDPLAKVLDKEGVGLDLKPKNSASRFALKLQGYAEYFRKNKESINAFMDSISEDKGISGAIEKIREGKAAPKDMGTLRDFVAGFGKALTAAYMNRETGGELDKASDGVMEKLDTWMKEHSDMIKAMSESKEVMDTFKKQAAGEKVSDSEMIRQMDMIKNLFTKGLNKLAQNQKKIITGQEDIVAAGQKVVERQDVLNFGVKHVADKIDGSTEALAGRVNEVAKGVSDTNQGIKGVADEVARQRDGLETIYEDVKKTKSAAEEAKDGVNWVKDGVTAVYNETKKTQEGVQGAHDQVMGQIAEGTRRLDNIEDQNQQGLAMTDAVRRQQIAAAAAQEEQKRKQLPLPENRMIEEPARVPENKRLTDTVRVPENRRIDTSTTRKRQRSSNSPPSDGGVPAIMDPTIDAAGKKVVADNVAKGSLVPTGQRESAYRNSTGVTPPILNAPVVTNDVAPVMAPPPINTTPPQIMPPQAAPPQAAPVAPPSEAMDISPTNTERTVTPTQASTPKPKPKPKPKATSNKKTTTTGVSSSSSKPAPPPIETPPPPPPPPPPPTETRTETPIDDVSREWANSSARQEFLKTDAAKKVMEKSYDKPSVKKQQLTKLFNAYDKYGEATKGLPKKNLRPR